MATLEISTVSARLAGDGYQTAIDADGHGMTSDVDASKGGRDAGPDPHELLLASLGACTVMTVRMYADRKGWPLRSVTATASHEARRSDGVQSHLFSIDLRIDADLTDEQRTRLVEIAHRCPIHRALMEPKTIDITSPDA